MNQMNERNEMLNKLFLGMDDESRNNVQKLQSVYTALMNEYDIEFQKQNKNNGKLLSLISQATSLDTVILSSIMNQININVDNSPLRFYLHSLSMVNNFLLDVVNNYEKNKTLLLEMYNLSSKEEVLGFLEVIGYINKVVQDLEIFSSKDLQNKDLN